MRVSWAFLNFCSHWLQPRSAMGLRSAGIGVVGLEALSVAQLGKGNRMSVRKVGAILLLKWKRLQSELGIAGSVPSFILLPAS